MPRTQLPEVLVAVGVIERDGQYFLCRRRAGAHLEGLWEFPGGKIRLGEDPRDTLVRELSEEVDVRVVDARLLHLEEFRYSDRAVVLYFFLCTEWAGEPRSMEEQDVRWLSPEELRVADVPPANRSFVKLLLEHA